MNVRSKIVSGLVLGLALVLASGLSLASGQAPQAGMGTAFTFQGRLVDAGGPVNDTCDFTFELYDQAGSGSPPTGGTLLGSQPRAGVQVSEGLFTVQLDYGAAAFQGEARWLEIEVDCGAGAAVLSPRQALTPAPYALYAASAGGAAWQGLQGVPAGFADGVDNDTTYSAGTGLALAGTALSLAPAYRLPQACGNGQIAEWNGSAWACGDDDVGGAFWSLGGNADTTPGTHFLGTTGNQALELKVNSARALRLEPNATSPNLVGGYPGNNVTAGVAGATIGGGGSSGWVQKVTDSHGTIGGGGFNQAGDDAGAVDDAAYATVAGGWYNVAGGPWSSIGGGFDNEASAGYTTVAGGVGNVAGGESATVGGGLGNQATGELATIAGGGRYTLDDPASGNRATARFSSIGGGSANLAAGWGATVAGGVYNEAQSESAAVGGGANNTATSASSTIGGGTLNQALAQRATVGGGESNTAAGDSATVGGGESNEAGASYATTGGGYDNVAGGVAATIAGGWLNEAPGSYASVGGGGSNYAGGQYATIAGGWFNQASGNYATVAGGGRHPVGEPGHENRATDNYATVGGGADNTAGNANGNLSDAEFATVAGGYQNRATGRQAAVGGGATNTAAYRATVGGGLQNTALGSYSTIPGGQGNNAAADYSFAAGYKARALHEGAFVWADAHNYLFDSYQANEFNIRATGGVRVALRLNQYGQGDWWCIATVANGGWSCTSDRNAKENLVLADGQEVLARLAGLPLYYWSATGDPVRHLGPMAQDFAAAYGLGDDETAISTIDLDGVALAAIQGLNQRLQAQEAQIAAQQVELQAQEAQIAAQQGEIQTLAARLAALEALLAAPAPEATGGGQ